MSRATGPLAHREDCPRRGSPCQLLLLHALILQSMSGEAGRGGVAAGCHARVGVGCEVDRLGTAAGHNDGEEGGRQVGGGGISPVLSIEGAPDARVRRERGSTNGVDSHRVRRERRLLQ
jgi:hypothetical protein